VKILLVKPSSLGDIIHALPAAAALRNMPGVERLDWVINHELAPVIEGSPVVSNVIHFPRRNLRALPGFLINLRRQRYDLAVDLQGLLRSALICAAARVRTIAGVADAREGAALFYRQKLAATSRHAVLRNIEAVQQLGAAHAPLHFPLPPLGLPAGFEPDPPYIVLHPHSKWPTKSLAHGVVKKIVEALEPQRVVIVGRGEFAPLQGSENWTNRTSLTELLAILRHARGVISTDSGPLHMACALDVPTVALFGPTVPQKTGPWSEHSAVVRLRLPCVPCQSRVCAWKEPHACLSQLPPHAIVRELHRLIGKKQSAPPQNNTAVVPKNLPGTSRHEMPAADTQRDAEATAEPR